MAPMQIKLRNAIGALKDQTSISLAKVSSTGIPDLDVAILKATSHEEVPMEEKYVQEVLHLTSYSRSHVIACVAGIGRRLSKTRTWIVAIKSLMLAHRLLRDGDPSFEAELRLSARSRGMRILNVSDFRDESESNGWDYSAFIQAYGRYLDERLDSCSMGGLLAATKPKPNQHRSSNNNYSASSKHYEYSDSSYYNDGYLSRDPEEEQKKKEPKVKAVKDMRADELMENFVIFQHLLERVLACRPSGIAKVNRLVNIALYPVVRESFLLYMDIRDGLAILHDAFFDMEPRECSRAFDIYTRAAKQIDELIAFYSFCKALGVCRTTEYPVVEKISAETLEVMDDFLRNRTISARRSHSPPSRSPRNDKEEEESYEFNGMKALPAPPLPAEESSSTSSASTVREAYPQQQANQHVMNKKGEDLIDIHEAPMSTEEHENKLALALFSGGAETKVNTKWEAFSSSNGEENGNGRPTIATIGNGMAGWELALIEAESEISKPSVNASLAGGFNNLLLESLYDQAETRQKTMAAVAPAGSASSVAMPGHAQSNFLALPAPPSAATALSEDPFAASVVVPPPPYVQMSEMRHKQQLLVQEQQQWLQYQQMSHPQGGYMGMAKYPNNPFGTTGASTFQQPNIYSVSYYGGGHSPFFR